MPTQTAARPALAPSSPSQSAARADALLCLAFALLGLLLAGLVIRSEVGHGGASSPTAAGWPSAEQSMFLL
jgi:hypothetical protein